MSKLKNFIAQEIGLAVTAGGLTAIRGGKRAVLADAHNGYSLGRLISGQIPHHYRTLEGIVADFASGTSALEAVLAMAASIPDAPSFQNSHCGEITASHFIQEHLQYRALYSKLTMISSQNTNAHKMDGLFVNLNHDPYEYLFVEAKASILPTANTKTKTHRSGILTQMLTSLNKYHDDDPRFELSRIRDNLSSEFSSEASKTIRKDLVPPGPDNLKFLGVSVTNAATVNADDDDFILSTACKINFDYYALIVSDLDALARESYGYWTAMKAAAN